MKKERERNKERRKERKKERNRGKPTNSHNKALLTILRLQFSAGLSGHETDHEAVVVLWAGGSTALRWGRGRADWGGGDVRPGDHWAGRGRGSGIPCGGQMLLVCVHVDGVQTHLRRAAGLALVLDSWRRGQTQLKLLLHLYTSLSKETDYLNKHIPTLTSIIQTFTSIHTEKKTDYYLWLQINTFHWLTIFVHACL